MICKKCNNEMNNNNKFCPKCGAKVEATNKVSIISCIGISTLIAIIIWIIPLISRVLSNVYSFDVDCSNEEIIYLMNAWISIARVFFGILTMIIGPFIIYSLKRNNKNIKKLIIILAIVFVIATVLVSINQYKYKVINSDSPYGPTIKKPILYIYPTKNTNISVKLSHPEYLQTTYPKYNNGWNVTVNTNGDMYDENGNYYYALYWDEKNINKEKFDEGFYVTKENAIEFLEEKLSYIGLNDKERNEFIMYWLPILEKNEKSIVNFDLTEEIQNENELIIEPKPDSLLRVHINIKKVNKKVNIKEQKLTIFNRTGYTAIEWGGTNY